VPVWVLIFLGLYFLVSVCLFLYGMHAYLMAWLHARTSELPPPPSAGGDVPRVTVQLPVFNERYVAARLIRAVAAFDYPGDRLQIQILDDSTDDTVEIVAATVAELRARGVDVVHRRRGVRTGFKAGALRDGLTEATGELIAVFDADFLPGPSFLRDTVPHFADPGVGMVQTRWGHLNEDYSLLTRAQAAALDGHFVIEQTVRSRNGAFMNFNGTAGVWRRQCILDAGNWQDDTLTEDLDLSYRAQLRGWRFVFLPDVVSPAELPAEVSGFKGQQFRWAKGSMQTAVKILPAVFRAPTTAFQRFQAFVHLTNHAVYPLLLLLGFMAWPALWVLERFPAAETAFGAATVLVIASFGHPWLYFRAERRIGRSRTHAALLAPLVVAGGMGIAVNNTRAFFEGWLGRQSPFLRTPKYAITRRGDGWHDKSYRAPVSRWTVLEVALAGYAATAGIYAVLHGRYAILPFLLLYVLGAGYVGSLSLAGWWEQTRTRLEDIASPPLAAPGTKAAP